MEYHEKPEVTEGAKVILENGQCVVIEERNHDLIIVSRHDHTWETHVNEVSKVDDPDVRL